MRRNFGLAGLAGVLYFCGFAGIDVWPLSFVCVIPLLWIVERGALTGKQAVWIGLLFGSVTNWGGYYWLIEMLRDFSGFALPLCLLFFLIICLYQGGQLALFFWLTWRVHQRGTPIALAAPLTFAASEFAYPLLFPNYFANSLHAQPLLMQVADLGGPVLLSSALVMANCAIWELVRALRARTIPVGAARWALLAGAAVWIFIPLYGGYRIGEVDARRDAAQKLKVGLVQVSMGHFEKRTDVAEGLRRHIQQSVELERSVSPDLIVWPESAVAYAVEDDTTNLRPLMGPLNTPILFGGLSARMEGGIRKLYNSAFLIDAVGDIQAIVDKSYLLAFGEYIPFGETFPILYEWSPHSGHFTPGRDQQPIDFGEHSLSVNICYEDILPAFVRNAVQRGSPDLLINLTNDSWFGDTTEPWIHLALAKFRAVEHHMYLVRATNSGVSAVIDPVGRVVTHTGVMTRESLHAEVAMMNDKTLYAQVGDWPGWLGLASSLLLLFRRRA